MERQKQNIETLLALSPIQKGILSYSLQAGTDDPYHYQKAFVLEGPLDPARFGQAWQATLDAHPGLRADYRWEEVPEPVQVVYRSVPLALETRDWRGEADPEAVLARWIADERQAGFPFRRAAGLRLLVADVGPALRWMVWSFHHIAIDGWSFSLVLRDALACYRALLAGQAWSAPPRAAYADYVRHLQSRDATAALEHWGARLRGFEAVTALPYAGAFPAGASGRAERRCRLSADETEALRRAARQAGVTINTLVQATWALVLARHAGTDDVLFGVTVSGRPPELPGIEDTVGLFINTLPLRVRLPSSMAVGDWLRTILQENLDSRQFDYLPPAGIQKQSSLQGSLFDSIVVFENFPVAGMLRRPFEGLRIRLKEEQADTPATSGRNNYPLSLIAHVDEHAEFAFAYARAVLDDDAIALLARDFQAVLTALPATLDAPVGILGLQSSLPAPPLPAAVHWPHRHVPAMFAHWVRTTPDALAVCDDVRTLSFSELDARAAALQSRLEVRPGERVGLYGNRCAAFVVGLLAAWRAGAAYVPLDPSQPPERLTALARDAGLRVLLLAGAADPGLPGVRSIDAGMGDIGTAAGGLPAPVRLHPAMPAYVIYTSGSTGEPKGVTVGHGALAAYIQAVLERLAPLPDGPMAMVSTVAADLGNTILFGALCAGRTLYMMDNGASFDPERYADAMDRQRPAVSKLAPTHLRGLLRGNRAADCLPGELLILGGEQLDDGLLQDVRRLKPSLRIVNHYGPTETTVGCLAGEAAPGAPVTLGTPLTGATAYVLDIDGNCLPPGAAGELFVGGDGVALGYLGQPGLTAERFLPDPFRPGRRMYRTGDRVRLQSDGRMVFLGRVDDQVKVRGFRVEPGEIAAQLRHHPGVAEAAVLVRETQLAACVVLRDTEGEGRPDEAGLRAWLGAYLPEHMVPARFVVLDRLPLNANGKLDRKALAALDAAPAPASTAPRDASETALVAIWSEVLRRDRIGIHENFFEMGGDSILSLQIIARARKRGFRITPKQMFENQTIAALARVLEITPQKPPGQVPPPEGALPLMPVQRRFFGQDVANRNHWNQSVLLDCPGMLDRSALAAALEDVVRHHDALRLRFVREADGWRQHYGVWQPQDLLWLAAPDEGAHALHERAQRSLDIGSGPLLRAALTGAGAGQHLLLVIHHLAVDGVSWRILLEDLQTAYRQRLSGEVAVLPPRTASYQAWAVRLLAYAAEPVLLGELDYWQAQLAGAPALPRELGDSDDEPRLRERGTVSARLERSTTSALLGPAGAAYRTRIEDLLLTALCRVLCRWSGQDALLVELEGHGREDVFDGLDVGRTVGWFTSLYPVLLRPQKDLPGSIKAVKEQLRAVPRRGLGYGVLLYLAETQLAAAQLDGTRPRVTFNYLGQFDGSFGAGALFAPVRGGGTERDEAGPMSNWLEIDGRVIDGALELSWGYGREHYREATISNLAAAFVAELEALVGHCLSPAAGGLTPSDVALSGLDQAALDALPAGAGVTDLYPLTPMQQGMLFHGLREPEAGLYIDQLCVDVDGLDPARLRAAWATVLARHDVLRSGFLWNGLAEPLQAVHAAVADGIEEEDWRAVPADSLRERLAAREIAERHRGFDLAAPPLQRALLLRLGEWRWRLVWTHHHLLTDGWSTARQMAEVVAVYGGAVPAAPAGRYRDHIAWLRQRDGGADEAFWRARLAPLEEPTLLADAVREGTGGTGERAPTGGHGVLDRRFDTSQSQTLRALAQTLRVTPNTLLQGAWALLLGMHTGQRQVCFGVTVAGRPAGLRGAEDMLGLFINTLPVTAALPPAMALGDWLRTLQDENVALREREHVALYEIQRWAGQAGAALFDTLLVFENYPVDEALRQAPAGLRFGAVETTETTNYALTLTASWGERLAVRFSYLRGQFQTSQVDALAARLERLLAGMAEAGAAGLPLGALSALSAREQAQWQAWSRGPRREVESVCLHELVTRQAMRTPRAVAVIDGQGELTYGELERRSNRLAHWLRGQGVGAEALVGIAAARSAQLMVGLLGILKAGGAYVPLDPDYPAERLAYMMRDSGIGLLLTQSALSGRLPGGPRHWCLDRDWHETDACPDTPPATGVAPQNLTYCIYTSGSTGKPKGAANTHAGIVNRLLWMQQAYGLTPGDRVAQKTPISFDVSVWELFWPLLSGAAVMMAPQDGHRDTAGLGRWMRQAGVTVLHFVPSMLQAMLVDGALARCDALRLAICSGEALPPDVMRAFQAQSPAALHNLYGPTEAAVDVTHWPCLPDAAQVPIGRPIDNMSVRLLDAALRPVPIGTPGELYLAGPGLARGYAGRPALTAERFVPDPFGPPGGRLYRTGDRACWREDGQLLYLGRLDGQIKLRGVRIETDEIAACLRELPGVADAAAMLRATSSGPQLVAYAAGPGLDGAALLHSLRKRLPVAMLPSSVITLEVLPLTSSGKLDRRALPDPGTASMPGRAPATPLEARLLALWQAVLGREAIGMDDNFFELGGHSLLATRLVTRIRAELGFELPLKALFEAPSIAALAAVMSPALDATAPMPDLADLSGLLDELEAP